VSARAFWEGQGGNEYTERNRPDITLRRVAFLRLVPRGSVLEVGANRGHNIAALMADNRHLVAGIDLNPTAAREALIPVLRGSATDIPAFDASFDLVFTCGVLIHVPPEDLPKAYDEMVRVSRKYVLIMEYYSEDVTSVTWRGNDGLLWKRPFGREMSERHPELILEATGDLGKDQGFDNVTWWRWRKP